MRRINLKLIPGDGIGVDVINEAQRVLQRLADKHGGVRFAVQTLPWGCQYYLQHGKMMPDDGLKILADCDAILLGAVGFPGVPDHISLQLLLPIRQQFDQYVNFRPVKLLEGLDSPLKVKSNRDIDFVVIRENTEGEYCGRGHLYDDPVKGPSVVQEAHFSRQGTARIIRYAFEYAQARGQTDLVSATKSNALNHSMVFWDGIFNEIRRAYPGIRSRSVHVDALAGLFILKPQTLRVVVASNLFGDILTDLGSAMLGSIGISPSANINPEKKYPSMFEPVHGSAPDIAGKGIANPVGALWSAALMLEHLAEKAMADRLMQALGGVLAERKVRTPDLGGTATTAQVAEAVLARI